MGNYAKLFGAIIGGVAGLAGEAGFSTWFLQAPELVSALSVLLGSMFGTWIAPRNAS